MFKKLKDKLTEEVKIPSQKFTQSMQQLAQAVVSPVSSSNSSYDTASQDNFSIDGEFDDTPQNSPVRQVDGGVAYRGGQATPIRNSFDSGSGAGFTHVDLQQDTSTPKMPSSLRSSFNSLASDSSFMFPVLESSGPTYNFQSDLESCSEASESVGPNINKEQLLLAYQKIQLKYHKYKGRYADLARHYRDLERDNKNAKHILTECQDKALRRMTELKEQCNLEKEAKAHLEEALRSDLEEKDHLIGTLKTKYCDAELQIKLLRNQVDHCQSPEILNEKPLALETKEPSDCMVSNPVDHEDLLTGGDSSPAAVAASAVLTPEPANFDSENVLKEKIKKLESLLHKCKEDITKKRENIKMLEAEKLASDDKIETLRQQLITIKKLEEDASLSLAKNKQTIHLELESKEDEIKKLSEQLAATRSKVSELQDEIAQIREYSEKELLSSKMEATKIAQAEREELLDQKRIIEEHLALREAECKSHEQIVAELHKRLERQETELNPLKAAKDNLEDEFRRETSRLKEEISKLKSKLENVAVVETKAEKLKTILESLQELQGLHLQLKRDFSKSQSDYLKLLSEDNHLIQGKIDNYLTEWALESERNVLQLEEHKRETATVKDALLAVTEKFTQLEQTHLSEKTGVETKMCDLMNTLREAEKKINDLEQGIESERTLRQCIENESSEKLASLQSKLEKEQDRFNILKESSSMDSNLQLLNKELEVQLKKREDENVNLTHERQTLRDKANELQISCDQLQEELGYLKTRDIDFINEITSLQMLLDEKNSNIENLERSLLELQSNLTAVLTEKDELANKLANKEEDLLSQISILNVKNQDAFNIIKNLEEKDMMKTSEIDKLTAKQNENQEKIKQIEDLKKTLIEAENSSVASSNEKQCQLEDLSQKCLEKEECISKLEVEKRKLQESLIHLESSGKDTSSHIQSLEKTNADLEKSLAETKEQLSRCAKAQDDLILKSEECKALSEKQSEAVALSAKLHNMLQSKSDECDHLTEAVRNFEESLSNTNKTLQDTMFKCENLTTEIRVSKESELRQCHILEDKEKEIQNYQKECEKLVAEVERLSCEKLELTAIINSKSTEIQTLVSHIESQKIELAEQSKFLKEKISECSELLSNLSSLTAENEKNLQLLKQKTMECDDKEAQLDSLADEMKRVEELSQELHRINDDRDANVEVLSTEASSLAQKVEELTVTTHQLKEREVDLLSKLQIAQDLETEYIAMKQREEALLLKLNEAKSVTLDLKTSEDELRDKSEKIKELQEENLRLQEMGSNLNELIERTRDAESKCKKLEDEGATLFLRVQKAEESVLKCSRLEEELEALKDEKSKMSHEIEKLQTQSIAVLTDQNNHSYAPGKEPVVEEPCVMKQVALLTENDDYKDGKEWQEKYNQLLREHQAFLQESAATIATLKEENLIAVSGRNVKQKERIWDRDETIFSEVGGDANGSFGTIEKLQHQLALITSQLKDKEKLHRQEVDDLHRILLHHGSGNSHASSKSDNLEDATELEYLRNILFEYMMGKEPMILARVIAAVVKFDAEQTSKVLQKEQQRLSLLGQLGIS